MSWVAAVVGGGAAGLVLGSLYFGGLLWTVRGLASSPRPGRLLAASFLVRFAVLGAAVALVLTVEVRLVVGLVPGILVARTLLTRRMRGEPAAGGPRPRALGGGS